MIQNTQISVTLSSELSLEQALNGAGVKSPATVTELTIAGMVTEKDFEYICQNMAGTLQELDISNTSVTEIGHRAFSDCKSLTSVAIPNSVIKINNWAFDHCESLTSIIVHPNNPVYSSENGVLFNKEKTVLVLYPEGRKGNYIIPDTVTEIGEYAFNGCIGLTSVAIPNSVIKIRDFAFSGCDSLVSVSIPNSVTKIGENAFSGCKGLTSVTIPASVMEIDNWAFSDCEGLTAITVHPDNPVFASENGVLFNKEKTELIIYPAGRKGSYTIPASVIEIRGDVWSCTGLTSITVHPDNMFFTSENGVLFNKSKTELLRFPKGRQGDYVIPALVKTIGEWAFHECEGLTSITIPASVTKIGAWAFDICTGLTSVIIPDSVIEIGFCAFGGCYGLTSFTIPASVTKEIDEWTFVDFSPPITVRPNQVIERRERDIEGWFDEEDETKIEDLPF